MGIPATGKKASMGAVGICRIKDGQVAEEIEDADLLGLFLQPLQSRDDILDLGDLEALWIKIKVSVERL